MTAYVPRSSGDPDGALISELVDRAWDGRLCVYVGAGLSRPSPTEMPTSAELVTRSAPEIRLRLTIEPEPPSGRKSLEAIGDEADSSGSLAALKSILARFADFHDKPPNFGHKVLALLVDEQLVRALSVNWDTCIERAAAEIGCVVSPTITDDDRRHSTADTRLHKLYGCISRPESLRVTTAEITIPARWAGTEVSTALATGSVVFIGLGTVPEQVSDAAKEVIATGHVADLVVVDPRLSDAWSEIGVGGDRHRAESGEFFLDALLCGVLKRLLGDALVEAQKAEGGTTLPAYKALQALAEAITPLPSMPVAKWLRDGACDRRPLIRDRSAIDALMAIGMYIGDRSPLAQQRGETATVSVGGCYLELAICQRQPALTLIDRESRRTQGLFEAGVYRDASATVVHFCSGHLGSLPRRDVADDIIDTPEQGDIIDGPASVTHRWVSIGAMLEGYEVTGAAV
jgi:hypothetical protein